MIKSNKLFQGADDWHNNACVNFAFKPEFGYAVGYKEAADLLVLNAPDMNKNDFFIYPIAFLYRHYIELRLKCIIDIGRQLLDIGDGFPQHHSIKELWSEVKKILDKICENSSIYSELNFFEEIIQEYSKIDPTSMAFRYPQDKKGNINLAGLTHINLRHLATNIDEAYNFLENILCMILEHLSYKQYSESILTESYYSNNMLF